MAGTRWIIEVLNWAPDGWETAPHAPQFTSRAGADAYVKAAEGGRDNRQYRAVQVPMEAPR